MKWLRAWWKARAAVELERARWARVLGSAMELDVRRRA